jgi:hypothetical protein
MNFEVGTKYTRNDIYQILNVPSEKQGGDWNTGYHLHKGENGDEHFLFATIVERSRTGHNYNNHFDNDTFAWEGKTGSKLHHASIQKLLASSALVQLFTRSKSRDPFDYWGRVTAKDWKDTEPVYVNWKLIDTGSPITATQKTPALESKEENSNNKRTAPDELAAMRPLLISVFQIGHSMKILAPDFNWSGNYVGDYGEFVAIKAYGLNKASVGTKGYDAVTPDNKKVEIKSNRKSSSIGFRSGEPDPDLFLVLRIKEDGDWEEIYYGDFEIVKKNASRSERDNKFSITVKKLEQLATQTV